VVAVSLPSNQPITVVGVIPTYLHTRLAADPSPQMYLSYLQRTSFASTSAIVIRTTPGSSGVAAAAMTLLRGLEKDLNVRAQTMAQNRWALLATERFRSAVLLTFAVTAVFLALLGIFGLVSYTVGQRQREIAIRVALGAIPGHVIRIASRHALVPAFAGLALGVAGALATTRLLSSYLVDIKPLDLPTFTGALAILALAAVLAGVIPARRALRIEPIEALRHE
jgi:ABC-type antimicrobial peptide transport system permease subunit